MTHITWCEKCGVRLVNGVHQNDGQGEMNTHESDEQGVQAIIFLQGLAGVTETREKAEEGWRAMDPHDRINTLMAYATMKKVSEDPRCKSIKALK